jgi:hypothetical protein
MVDEQTTDDENLLKPADQPLNQHLCMHAHFSMTFSPSNSDHTEQCSLIFNNAGLMIIQNECIMDN